MYIPHMHWPALKYKYTSFDSIQEYILSSVRSLDEAILIISVDIDMLGISSERLKHIELGFLTQEEQKLTSIRILKYILGGSKSIRFSGGLTIEFLFKNVFKKKLKILEAEPLELSSSSISTIKRMDLAGLLKHSSHSHLHVKTMEQLSHFKKPVKKTPYDVVAIDAEMLITQKDKEIGRFTIVDSKYNTIYDKYICPSFPVLDYLELYSGLTYENTSNGISKQELQSEILDIIGKDTYVIGHSVEHDLICCSIYPNYIIDTSYIFIKENGSKVKLRDLSNNLINKKIQNGSHSSVEDSTAALDLVAYAIKELRSIEIGTSVVEESRIAYIKNFEEISENKFYFINAESLEDLEGVPENIPVILLYRYNYLDCIGYMDSIYAP